MNHCDCNRGGPGGTGGGGGGNPPRGNPCASSNRRRPSGPQNNGYGGGGGGGGPDFGPGHCSTNETGTPGRAQCGPQPCGKRYCPSSVLKCSDMDDDCLDGVESAGVPSFRSADSKEGGRGAGKGDGKGGGRGSGKAGGGKGDGQSKGDKDNRDTKGAISLALAVALFAAGVFLTTKMAAVAMAIG